MPLSQEQLVSDQERVFTDFPTEPIYVNGTEFDCLILNSVEGTDVVGGGFRNEDSHRVAIERGTVENIPVEGQTVLFRGRAYDVMRVERDDGAASIVLDIAARESTQQS